MIINDFKKCLNHRRELLGSNIVRRPRLGDRMISVLYYGESIFLNEHQCLSGFMIFYLREGRVGPMRGVGRS